MTDLQHVLLVCNLLDHHVSTNGMTARVFMSAGLGTCRRVPLCACSEFVDLRKIAQLAFYLGSTWHEEERHQVYLVFDRNLDVRGQHISIEEKVISNDVRILFQLLGVPLDSQQGHRT